jgi:hypothetical protein
LRAGKGGSELAGASLAGVEIDDARDRALVPSPAAGVGGEAVEREHLGAAPAGVEAIEPHRSIGEVLIEQRSRRRSRLRDSQNDCGGDSPDSNRVLKSSGRYLPPSVSVWLTRAEPAARLGSRLQQRLLMHYLLDIGILNRHRIRRHLDSVIGTEVTELPEFQSVRSTRDSDERILPLRIS